jgi:hypothetical protein
VCTISIEKNLNMIPYNQEELDFLNKD